MPSSNPSRRLTTQILNQDTDSLIGLNTIQGYNTQRQEAMPEALQQAYRNMLAKQQNEIEKLALYRAAVDAARSAEWDFHNSVLAMKEVVRGQFGADSNEAQAVGLKKKSERKRPTRQKVAVAS
jgi:hypothetical protein